MIKVLAYEHYHDVIQGFYHVYYYNDNEYKAIVQDMLDKDYVTYSVRRVEIQNDANKEW